VTPVLKYIRADDILFKAKTLFSDVPLFNVLV
jgi:hypothetical protein